MRLERKNLGQKSKCRTAGGDDGISNDDGEASLDKKSSVARMLMEWLWSDIYYERQPMYTLPHNFFNGANFTAGSDRGYYVTPQRPDAPLWQAEKAMVVLQLLSAWEAISKSNNLELMGLMANRVSSLPGAGISAQLRDSKLGEPQQGRELVYH